MGAVAAEAPLRLPAAPPLAFCCYTSVLLLFAFSLPGSRASNQPPGGGGGGGDCPGGKGKSINCSGRIGRSAPLPPLLPSPPRLLPPGPRDAARPGRGVGGPGSRAERERGLRAGRERAMRAWGPAWGRGVAVRASVCAKWLGAGGRACAEGRRPGRQVGGSRPGLPVWSWVCTRERMFVLWRLRGGKGRPEAGLFCCLCDDEGPGE